MRYHLSVPFLCLFLTAGLLASCAAGAVRYSRMPANADAADTLVGIDYFAGWWPESPNKWQDRRTGHDWRADYPERVPLLGEFNNQETMDREIVAAADYGVDFFAILWYPVGLPSRSERGNDGRRHERNLNRGLDDFMASPNAGRMKFFVEFCNHQPFRVVTDEDWNYCTGVWLKAMAHPSYLRVGGRLVFKFHSGGRFYEDCDGDIQKCRARLNDLRDKVRKAGLGEMVICGGNMGPVKEGHWALGLFDFGGDYNAVLVEEKAKGGPDQPFALEADFAARIREERSRSLIPYMPFLLAGWNPRPWHGTTNFALPTRAQWKAELERVARELSANPNLGIPLPDGRLQKAFNIYAWNEFGEGGFVAPTRGDGYMKLECIREVFGVKKPSEKP
ncbi:MAG: hypothetical protein M1457_06640 [bacterium]|nr:hypothetical protein [bacterium]